MPPPHHQDPLPDLPKLSVLYREPDMLVVQKPPGLLVHNSPFTKTREATAMDAVHALFGDAFCPVHRLDRQTSGALLFATRPRVADWQKALSSAQKEYVALCRGHYRGDTVVVDHAFVDKTHKDRRRVEAVTEIGGIANSQVERCALLFARPRTGRTHQVRRHVRHLTHPILADANYGKGKLNRFYKERYGLARLALHCAKISFALEERELSVHAPMPQDLWAVFEQLGLGPSFRAYEEALQSHAEPA